MRATKEDLPVFFEDGAVVSRHVQWGDMNVAYKAVPRGVDVKPLLRGLPNNRCQCPHWGYLFKGRMRVVYEDHDELVNAGDFYYAAPGHIEIVEEDSELVELSPKGTYLKTVEVILRNVEALQKTAHDDSRERLRSWGLGHPHAKPNKPAATA